MDSASTPHLADKSTGAEPECAEPKTSQKGKDATSQRDWGGGKIPVILGPEYTTSRHQPYAYNRERTLPSNGSEHRRGSLQPSLAPSGSQNPARNTKEGSRVPVLDKNQDPPPLESSSTPLHPGNPSAQTTESIAIETAPLTGNSSDDSGSKTPKPPGGFVTGVEVLPSSQGISPHPQEGVFDPGAHPIESWASNIPAGTMGDSSMPVDNPPGHRCQSAIVDGMKSPSVHPTYHDIGATASEATGRHPYDADNDYQMGALHPNSYASHPSQEHGGHTVPPSHSHDVHHRHGTHDGHLPHVPLHPRSEPAIGHSPLRQQPQGIPIYYGPGHQQPNVAHHGSLHDHLGRAHNPSSGHQAPVQYQESTGRGMAPLIRPGHEYASTQHPSSGVPQQGMFNPQTGHVNYTLYATPGQYPNQTPYIGSSQHPIQAPYAGPSQHPNQATYAGPSQHPNQALYAGPSQQPNQAPYADPSQHPGQATHIGPSHSNRAPYVGPSQYPNPALYVDSRQHSNRASTHVHGGPSQQFYRDGGPKNNVVPLVPVSYPALYQDREVEHGSKRRLTASSTGTYTPTPRSLSRASQVESSVDSQVETEASMETIRNKRRRTEADTINVLAREAQPPPLTHGWERRLENLVYSIQTACTPTAGQTEAAQMIEVVQQLLKYSVETHQLLRQVLASQIPTPGPGAVQAPAPAPPTQPNQLSGDHAVDRARHRTRLEVRHFSPGSLALNEEVRALFNKLLVAAPPDPDAFARWRPGNAIPFPIATMYLDFTQTAFAPWNKAVSHLFIDLFLQSDAPSIARVQPDRKDIKRLFESNFRNARNRYRRLARNDPVADEAEKRLDRRNQRKSQLLIRRGRVLNYYEPLRQFVVVAELLGRDGMSTDESSHENGTGVYTYTARRHDWLHWDITNLFRLCDALYRHYRSLKHRTSIEPNKPKADSGSLPRIRLSGDKVSPSPPIRGLPEDFYDTEWIGRLTDAGRAFYNIQPKLGLNVAIPHDLWRLASEYDGKLDSLHTFI